MTDVSPTRHAFSVGEVLSLTFAIFFKNLGPLLGMAFVVGLPSLLMQFSMVESAHSGNPNIFNPGWFLSTLLAMILSFVLTGAVVYAVYLQLRGQPMNIGGCVGVAVRRLVPLILVSILVGILTAIGFMILIIPGIVLWLMFFVAVPTTVVERVGPFDALSRSRELTAGRRWQILGLAFLFFLIALMVNGLIGMFVNLSMGPTSAGALTINWAMGMVANLIQAIGMGVAYYQLRREKEGLDLSDLAEVFA